MNYGASILYNYGLLEDIRNQISGWWLGSGRLNILGIVYTKIIYWYIHSALVIKILVTLMVTASVLQFGRLLRKLTGSDQHAFFCMLILPMTFQFRNWHDPITNFLFLIPLVVVFSHASVASLIDFGRSKNKSSIYLSIFWFLLAVLTYELAYLYIFIFAIIFYFYEPLRQFSKLLLLYIAIVLLHIAIAKFWIFYNSSTTGAGIHYPNAAISFSFPSTLFAYVYQLTGALPLTWKLSKGSLTGLFPLGASFILFLIFYGVVVKFLLAPKNGIQSINIGALRIVSAVSFILIVLFPVLPAVSGHGSDIATLGFGYAYITVFAQQFGIATLIGTLIYCSLALTKSPANTLIKYSSVLILSLVSATTWRENNKLVESSLYVSKHSPNVIKTLFSDDFFSTVDFDRDVLVMNYRTPFNNAMYLSQVSRRPIKACYINSNVEFNGCLKKMVSSGSRLFVFNYTLSPTGRLEAAVLCPTDILSLTDGEVRSFYAADKCVVRDREGEVLKELKTLNLMKLLYLPATSTEFDLLSPFLNDSNLASIRLSGVHRPESDGKNISVWVTNNAEVNVQASGLDKNVNLCFTLVRPATSPVDLELRGVGRTYTLSNFTGRKSICLPLPEGQKDSILYISSTGEPANSDPRVIRFGIENWTVVTLGKSN
jgi:hypothetical protein